MSKGYVSIRRQRYAYQPGDLVKAGKKIYIVKGVFNYGAWVRLTQKFWGSGLWSNGYYVGTAGTVTAETIHKYIEEQKSKG